MTQNQLKWTGTHGGVRAVALLVLAAMVALLTAMTGIAAAQGSAEATALTSTACAFYAPGHVTCYKTAAMMGKAILAHDARTASPDSACGASPWLYLYQNSYMGGQVLALDNVAYWVDLQSIGFGNEMSSWVNTSTCNAYGTKSTDGTGQPLTMAAESSSNYVGNFWNDAVNSTIIG